MRQITSLVLSILIICTTPVLWEGSISEESVELSDYEMPGGYMDRDHFIKNGGQLSREDIMFYSLGRFRAGFAPDSIVYAVSGDGVFSYEVRFVDSNNVKPVGLDPVSTLYNFFGGSDLSRWASDLSGYDSIVYEDLWTGVDLIFYSANGKMKYDILVHPGGEVDDISFEIIGTGFHIPERGESIIIGTPFGNIEDGGLVAYQGMREISVSFIEQDDQIYGLAAAGYDPDTTLVIDPLLRHCTYLGGSETEYMNTNGFAVHNGDIFAFGGTYSSDFPLTPGAIDSTIGSEELFLSRMDGNLSNLKYSTYIGGSDHDVPGGIFVDSSGNAYITGNTDSKDFPTTPGAMNETSKIRTVTNEWGWEVTLGDAFLTKINASGSSILYSTFIGGNDVDRGVDVSVSNGYAYVSGSTESTDLPTINAYSDDLSGNMDIFVMKINKDGSSAEYSTYIGGIEMWYEDVIGIEVDESGRALIAGYTDTSDFPTTDGAYKRSFTLSRYCIFLARLDSSGSSLDMSTFLFEDSTPDSFKSTDDGILITGSTYGNLPVTGDAYQNQMSGREDAFMGKIDLPGSNLIYCSYFGGSDSDYGRGIDMDGDGRVILAGSTFSNDLKAIDGALFKNNQGGLDGFIARFSSDMKHIDLFTYFGGKWNDDICWGASFGNEMVVFGGVTSGSDLPVSDNALDRSSLRDDVFIGVMKINSYSPDPPQNITIERGDENLTLRWSPPENDGNESLTQYSIYVSKLNRSFEVIGQADPEDTTFHHQKLDNGERYYYFITSNNIVGESEPSKRVMGIPARPPSAPILETIVTEDETVILKWSDPEDIGGDANIVFHVYCGEDVDSMTLIASGLTGFEFVHGGLINGRTYHYSISASNDMGEGPLSLPVHAIPMKLPSSPLKIHLDRGPGFIHLFWEEPEDNGGDPSITYTVYLSPDGEGNFEVIASGLEDTDLNVTGLENGRPYLFKVSAVNEKGEGMHSDIIGEVPLGVPGPPLGPEVEFYDTRAYLTWFPPDDTGGDEGIVYRVYMAPAGSDPELIFSGIRDAEYRLTGLTNGVSYDLFITALNTVFEGPPSNTVSGTPVGPSSKPLDLEIIPGNGNARLTWTPPTDNGGGNILSYSVYRGFSEDHLSEMAQTGLTTYLSEGLKNGITYFFSVRARNSFGPGQMSTPFSVVPMAYPGIPEIIIVRGSDRSISIEWKPPSDKGGASTLGYNIYASREGEKMEIHYQGTFELKHTVTGLQNGVEYKLGVTAFNTRGEGLMSDIIRAVPMSAPPQPLNISLSVEAGMLNISWKLPDDDGGSPLTEIVIYRWEDDNEPLSLVTVSGDTGFFHDKRISKGVTYNYKVRGRTEMGTTPDSNLVAGMVPENEKGIDALTIIVLGTVILLAVMGLLIFVMTRKMRKKQQTVQYVDPRSLPVSGESSSSGLPGTMSSYASLPRGPDNTPQPLPESLTASSIKKSDLDEGSSNPVSKN